MPPVHLFLLPHQDDEYGVFHLLERAVERGHRPVCIYLTDGSLAGADPQVRDAESRKVLTALGVAEADIHFLGSRFRVPDGGLAEQLGDALPRVLEVAAALGAMESIQVPAWEGGHEDHDAACALAVVAAQRWRMADKLRQFPLYTAGGRKLWPYRVLAPISENGPVDSTPIPASRRVRYLRLCLTYRSQLKSMTGLMPFIASHYAIRGTQDLQRIDPVRLRERPHPGPLLYERMRGGTFESFGARIGRFLDATGAT
ncbi:MAG: PIG-L family deacetylase [Alphaproteobacteria bacterium]|nr:PIG-L family deacetylase [Alphaproteobacteria bacterium]